MSSSDFEAAEWALFASDEVGLASALHVNAVELRLVSSVCIAVRVDVVGLIRQLVDESFHACGVGALATPWHSQESAVNDWVGRHSWTTTAVRY